jgi:apolipoprotein N-acyltransferase
MKKSIRTFFSLARAKFAGYRATLLPWLPLFRGSAIMIAGILAGRYAINADLPSAGAWWSITQGFLLAGLLLAIGARVARTRLDGFVLLLGWYLGALLTLPFVWSVFFGTKTGWAAWIGLSLLLAAPAWLTSRRRPALGVALAIVLAAVPPLGFLGMVDPLLCAGAFFPGWGWGGLVLMLVFFILSASRAKWAVLLQIVMLGWGLMMLRLPPPAVPDTSWGATTYTGAYDGSNLVAHYRIQDEAKSMVTGAVVEGAKLIVMPETTNPLWDDGAKFYWRDVADAARERKAQALIGVYTNPLVSTQRVDGIVDLTSGELYPARVTLPLAMWRPWSHDSFTLHLNATRAIPTPYGPAAYLICYEELLAWPLPWQIAHQRPALLVSIANQWFAQGWLSKPQERAVAMQARLWRLPLIRAVNQGELHF